MLWENFLIAVNFEVNCLIDFRHHFLKILRHHYSFPKFEIGTLRVINLTTLTYYDWVQWACTVEVAHGRTKCGWKAWPTKSMICSTCGLCQAPRSKRREVCWHVWYFCYNFYPTMMPRRALRRVVPPNKKNPIWNPDQDCCWIGLLE